MNDLIVNQVAAKIASSERIVISSHLRPDGDSICTALALAFMCEALGKEALIINHDPTPFPFNFFPDVERIRIGQIYPERSDCVILLECASVERSGQNNLDGYFIINIDHHYSNFCYANLNWVDSQAAAVGEMVFFLAQVLKIKLTPKIASHLYCAIASDTGNFQFSNTNARTFLVCHHLVEAGADPAKISELLFSNYSPEKIKLLGLVLSTLRMNSDGRMAIITMFRSFLERLGLSEVDTEDITTLARSIRGVELVLFFKEIDSKTFRISLRSKGEVNAAVIAERFGGGGHVHAAGFTAHGSYETLIQEIPQKIERLLSPKNS
ncbi:MAG: bifunctional oligoribonuclease/PAP phosphatase NrnA [Candidatus Aminicenantes bacterium]|nr:bifunctional oligoribonuclease/PAP phosphatase NrnA [Candidatus Aminicenantes bacterium]